MVIENNQENTPQLRFSYEEIYSMFGQYDKFVSLTFHHNSDAAQRFKSVLMGVFRYTQEERQLLEDTLNSDVSNIPRSNKYTKFIPSELENLSQEQITELDRDGILNADIAQVSSSNFERENRFMVKGNKNFPSRFTVNFDADNVNIGRLKLGQYKSRLQSSQKLIQEEEYEYYGLQLYFNSNQLDEALQAAMRDESNGLLKEPVRYYQLNAKYFDSDLTEEETKEYKELLERRTEIKWNLLLAELNRSGQSLIDIYHNKNLLRNLISICSDFKDEVLIFSNPNIWWDMERFLHIYLRHVKETKLGVRFRDKTIFQYKFKDIRRIVIAVIKTVIDEIEAHFKQTPAKNFRRMGTRSVYFDGIYYSVEIEPSGKIATFYPYNYNEEKKKIEA